MTAEQTAKIVQTLLEDKRARDIEVMNVEGKTILADRFVIATGTSVTHIKALADDIEFSLKDQHQRMPDHIEGYSTGRWILMDYGDVIVHILHQDERDFYSLEKLWQEQRRTG